jgi:hypothetical protein
MKKLTTEEIVELGDKIHNADEIICLTHNLDKKTEQHDLHIVVVGEQDALIHLLAKQFCENHDFFNLVSLALNKIDYKITNQ